MPWYDYQCAKCGGTFEVQRPFGATGKVKCTACGSTRTLKVFSPAMVQFKGSGFYVTDSKGGRNPALGVSASDSSDNGSADHGKDAAAKVEQKTSGEPSGNGARKHDKTPEAQPASEAAASSVPAADNASSKKSA